MYRKVSGKISTRHFDTVLDVIPLSFFEARECNFHVLARFAKAENVKRFKRVALSLNRIIVIYLAGKGKWTAFQGGQTFLRTTISLSQ